MHRKTLLFFWLISCAPYAVLNAAVSDALVVSISIPARDDQMSTQHQGAGPVGVGSLRESRELSFSPPQAHFHVLVSNISTNVIRLWREDYSTGYEALSFEFTDAAGNRWTAKKKPRPWRNNSPRCWVLKPKETLVIDVEFTDTNVWEGFRVPPKDSEYKLELTAIFDIPEEVFSQEYDSWTGRIVSAPVEVTFRY